MCVVWWGAVWCDKSTMYMSCMTDTDCEERMNIIRPISILPCRMFGSSLSPHTNSSGEMEVAKGLSPFILYTHTSKQKQNKYFELKNSWGCRPNSNYLLTQSQVRYMTICSNLPIQKALACTQVHSCKGTQTRTDCAIISFFPLLIRSCTKQSCYSYLAT